MLKRVQHDREKGERDSGRLIEGALRSLQDDKERELLVGRSLIEGGIPSLVARDNKRRGLREKRVDRGFPVAWQNSRTLKKWWGKKYGSGFVG